ncbi:IclR family transcriptional regulator [Kineosporia babensis]|uniref:Uncharacterized protein n=1 Tax=Kineosporia babensis TaxID=499548 RepID=A0A9X1NI24_9ACTN|nr:hypothetical protein [Kineosporia babensis]MCD5313939.1 hypothetical protein [Kineosporia babensis]
MTATPYPNGQAVAWPFVDALVDRVHCTVHVGAVNGDEIVYLIRADSDMPYRMPSRVGPPARTPNTITTLAGLRTETAWIQQQGYTP